MVCCECRALCYLVEFRTYEFLILWLGVEIKSHSLHFDVHVNNPLLKKAPAEQYNVKNSFPDLQLETVILPRTDIFSRLNNFILVLVIIVI